MTAGEIRRELDRLLESGDASTEDYQRLSAAWRAIAPTVLPSYHAVIVDRLYELGHIIS